MEKKLKLPFFLFFVLLPVLSLAAPEGKRPYEMDWANRFSDEVPPLADFESGTWTVETDGTIADFQITQEQKIWDRSVGKLTYRRDPNSVVKDPSVKIRPEKPLDLNADFDAISVWVYGNNWAWVPETSTPRVTIDALFLTPDGSEVSVRMDTVRWREWFLLFKRPGEEALKRLHEPGAKFNGFLIGNCRNEQDRAIFFDNFAIRKEEFKPLTFKPRPKRGIIIPQQNQGLNTGEGTLPFPNRPETILPENKTADFKNSLEKFTSSSNDIYTFKYAGKDGTLKYRFTTPKADPPEFSVSTSAGTPWNTLEVSWNNSVFTLFAIGGGVDQLAVPEKPTLNPWKVTAYQFLSSQILNENSPTPKLETRWKLTAANPKPGADASLPEALHAEVCYRFSIQGKTLIVETESSDLTVANVSYGKIPLAKIGDAEIYPIPYYTYSYSSSSRPGFLCFQMKNQNGLEDTDSPHLFLMGNTDWYLNNGSEIYGKFILMKNQYASFNGGVRYRPKTDGKRNPCFERFMFTLSPDFEEILPTLPNPPSPWKHVTGPRHWYAHGATVRENDKKMWKNVHRHGMTQVVVTDHEVGWRDGGESFTFRTKAAPGKGGDEGMRDYSNFMNRELNFIYGPYNNFTDFAPVNEYWSTDMPSRTPDNQFLGAWARCYAPKPAWAVEYCEKLTPINQKKFNFRTAYCDVHTAVSASSRVDYDCRVPGAGTQAATFYAFGEIMLLQKAAWGGPVYSEGNQHFPYSGLTDGNYAQDQGYPFFQKPWLVNLDLRKMHDLCCNFGMGNPGMFYPHNSAPKSDTPATRDVPSDRFFTAALAFGHPGFLSLQYGMRVAMRGYFNAQQLQSRFTQVSADKIFYADADGKLLDVSEALAARAANRSQIVVKYTDGTVICANGSMTETMQTSMDGRGVSLPPNGYTGWTADKKIFTFSGLRNGSRCDYAVSPEYIFLDGRDFIQTFELACGNGAGLCRKVDENHWEIILLEGSQTGFRIPALSAAALNEAGEEIGPAKIFKSRGFTYVEPVEGAFSYLLTLDEKAAFTPVLSEDPLACPTPTETGAKLQSARHFVVPGETVQIQTPDGVKDFTIPGNAEQNQRIWFEYQGEKIDFCVRSYAQVKPECTANSLTLHLHPVIQEYTELEAEFNGIRKPVENGKVTFPLPMPEAQTAAETSPEKPLQETFTILISPKNSAENAASPNTFRQSVTVKSSFFMDFASQPLSQDSMTTFQHLDGKSPAAIDSANGTAWYFTSSLDCGETSKNGFAAHPPYQQGSGEVYAEWEIDLDETFTTLAAFVGKRNGSDLGDGIYHQISVTDPNGKIIRLVNQHIVHHEWQEIHADLSPWKGQKIILRLTTNPGKNTAGDWSAWADVRLQSPGKLPHRQLIQ